MDFYVAASAVCGYLCLYKKKLSLDGTISKQLAYSWSVLRLVMI